MRNVTYFCFIAVIAWISTGCNHKSSGKPETIWKLSQVDYPEIPESGVVRLDKTDFPIGEIRSIKQIPLNIMIENRELIMFIKGDYILIKHLEMRKGACLLHVVSLPDYKVVAKLAPFGEGPDDFYDIRLIPTEEEDKLCYIREINKGRIFYLTSSLELKEYGKLVDIPDFLYSGDSRGSLYIGNDTLLTSQGGNNGKGICKVNLKDSTVRGIIPFHFIEGANSFFYLGDMAHSFQKKRGAFAFTYNDRLAFFDFDGEDIKLIQFGNKDMKAKSMPEILNSGNNTIYRYDCFGNDNYVYAIYRESANDLDKSQSGYLEQFDWNGKPVARYLLPEGHGFYSGYTTDNDSVIYLIDYYEDNFLHKVVLKQVQNRSKTGTK